MPQLYYSFCGCWWCSHYVLQGWSHSVNGPAKVIAVILLGLALIIGTDQEFNYGYSLCGFRRVTSCFRRFEIGPFIDIFHSSVIQGLLAAIGIIIFG